MRNSCPASPVTPCAGQVALHPSSGCISIQEDCAPVAPFPRQWQGFRGKTPDWQLGLAHYFNLCILARTAAQY